MPAVTISNSGNLVKITINGKVQYFETGRFIESVIIDTTSLIVSFTYKNYTLFSADLSDITINGIVLSDVASFEDALRTLLFSFSKLDPLVAVGFMSTAITSPYRRITMLGNNPDVDQSALPETIWPAGGLYSWMTGATSLEAVSTSVQDSASGTGIASISITFLDINYNESNVLVALNGTTPVAIAGQWFRINGAVTIAKGSGAAVNRATNAGDIIIRTAGGGTTRAIILAGKGISRQAIYTVPAGYSLQILSHYIGLNRGPGTTRYLTVSNFVQNSAGVARTPLDISCDGEPYRHDGLPGVTIPEKTDYALEAVAVSADNSDVTGAFLGLLMKNNLISSLNYP